MKKHVEEGQLYAAVCAAPAVVLGPWGLLNGLKVRFALLYTLLCCVTGGDGFGDCVCGGWTGDLFSYIDGEIGLLRSHYCRV